MHVGKNQGNGIMKPPKSRKWDQKRRQKSRQDKIGPNKTGGKVQGKVAGNRLVVLFFALLLMSLCVLCCLALSCTSVPESPNTS